MTPALSSFGRKLTLAAALTAASVQGDTVEGTVCIEDLANPHMARKDMLEMAAGRARDSRNLRFL